MEIGLLIKWGKLVPGREEQAINLFAEGTDFFGKKMADGTITFFDPFFVRTSDLEEWQGAFYLKGPAEKMYQLVEDPDYLFLMDKAFYVVEHLAVNYLTVGEGVSEQLARSAKVRAELGIH